MDTNTRDKKASRPMLRFPWLCACVCVALWGLSPLLASGPIEPEVDGLIDLPMYRDPVLEPPVEEVTFHPRLNELWRSAMGRDDAELRRQAAAAFGRAAELGMTVDEASRSRLVELLRDEDRAVRLAVVDALRRISHAAAAEAMLAINRESSDVDLILATDRALAQWRHEPATAVWIGRLSDEVEAAIGRSATRSLGEMAAGEAFDALSRLAVDARTGLTWRMEAAEAIGKLLAANQVEPAAVAEVARPLVAGDVTQQRLAAAMLAVTRDFAVPEDGGPRAELLARLLDSEDPVVIAPVITALKHADPSAMTGRFDALLNHDDPAVRLAAVDANLSVSPNQRHVTNLVGRLDDPSVRVRHAAREQLALLAADSAHADAVRSGVTQGLSATGWRGLEQAALLAGALDHEAAADRLVDLLRHDRAEVRLAAAAALRQLAMPTTLPAMLRRAEELAEVSGMEAGREQTQLFMAFGEMKHSEADSLLRKYVPKNSGHDPMARGAAVYALGKIYEDDPQAAGNLANLLAGRLGDVTGLEPEGANVRRFSAIGLGRLKAQRHLALLRRFLEEENGSVDIGGASRWAIMQITGETLPPLDPLTRVQTRWFLEPVE